MAELRLEDGELVVELSPLERAEAVHGDVRIPAVDIADVEVLEDVRHAVHGLKMPGSALRGYFAVGTFYSDKGARKTFAVVHHHTPRGVRVELHNAEYDEIVVGADDPEALVARLLEGH